MDIVSEILSLEESTTFFLEHLRNDALLVQIKSQSEISSPAGLIIKRSVILYFERLHSPALYSVSFLYKNLLTENELKLLENTNTPIGRIFNPNDQPSVIFKKNIRSGSIRCLEISEMLKVRTDLLWTKTYDFWVGTRNIGNICEYFNYQSLQIR